MGNGPISDPLWDLMTAANNCAPGCACDNDRFEITSERVSKWIQEGKRGSPAARAQDQLDTLLALERLDHEALADQTNVFFETESEARTWLKSWRPAILESINHKP